MRPGALSLAADDCDRAAERFAQAHQPPLDLVADKGFLAAADVQLDGPVRCAEARPLEHRSHSPGQALPKAHRDAPAMRPVKLLVAAQLDEGRVKIVASESRRKR